MKRLPFVVATAALSAVALGAVLAARGDAEGEIPAAPAEWWSGVWQVEGEAAKIRYRRLQAAAGAAAVRKRGGRACRAPTAYYRGVVFGDRTPEMIVGCTKGPKQLGGRYLTTHSFVCRIVREEPRRQRCSLTSDVGVKFDYDATYVGRR